MNDGPMRRANVVTLTCIVLAICVTFLLLGKQSGGGIESRDALMRAVRENLVGLARLYVQMGPSCLEDFPDPWDNPVEVFEREGASYLRSAGPDGIQETSDDIVVEIRD